MTRIDHLLTHVPSLSAATEHFERMGFQLSPVSTIDAMGVANRMVLMRSRSADCANYIELMTAHDPAKLPDQMRSVLSGAGGIGSMVLQTADIEALARTVYRSGFAQPEVFHVRREWKIPGEPSVYPEFDVILPVEAPLRFNACCYYNVELYQREDWLTHPNGAQRLSAVFAVAPRPTELHFLSDILGAAATPFADGGLRFVVDDVRLDIRSEPGHAGSYPRYLGYEIEVISLSDLQQRFDRERVPYRREADGSLCVPSDFGQGNTIVFVQKGHA